MATTKTYTTRGYRLVGEGTDGSLDALGATDKVAVKAVMYLRRIIGADFNITAKGTDVTMAQHSDTVELAGDAIETAGRYRVSGTQPVAQQCAHCERQGSIKWGKTHCCTDHASFEALVWDAVRRTNAVLKQALQGTDSKVTVTITPDPRLV